MVVPAVAAASPVSASSGAGEERVALVVAFCANTVDSAHRASRATADDFIAAVETDLPSTATISSS